MGAEAKIKTKERKMGAEAEIKRGAGAEIKREKRGAGAESKLFGSVTLLADSHGA